MMKPSAPRASKVGLDKMQTLLISRHVSKKQRRKNKIKEFLDSKLVNVLIITISLWSLFSNDIRVSSFPVSADLGFDVVTVIMFVMFCCEIAANMYCREDYFSVPDLWNTTIVKTTALRTWARKLQLGSFYFWLDCIATLSLILEVNLPLYFSYYSFLPYWNMSDFFVNVTFVLPFQRFLLCCGHPCSSSFIHTFFHL